MLPPGVARTQRAGNMLAIEIHAGRSVADNLLIALGVAVLVIVTVVVVVALVAASSNNGGGGGGHGGGGNTNFVYFGGCGGGGGGGRRIKARRRARRHRLATLYSTDLMWVHVQRVLPLLTLHALHLRRFTV